jgi:hypothetical protein
MIAGMRCQSAMDIQYQTCQRLIARENRSELEHSLRIDYLAVLSRVYARCQGFQKNGQEGGVKNEEGKAFKVVLD